MSSVIEAPPTEAPANHAVWRRALLRLIYHMLRASTWVLRLGDYLINRSTVKLRIDNQNPYADYAVLRERAAVLRSYSNRGWLISRHAEVTELFRDPRLSNYFGNNQFLRTTLETVSGRKDIPFFDHPSLQQVDPPDHTRLRKLMARGFLRAYIDSLKPTIEGIVDGLIAGIGNASSFDLIEQIAKPLPAIVIAEMLGVPDSDRHRFEQWSEDLLGIAEIGDPNLLVAGLNADADMREYMVGLVAAKKRQPGNDFISALIAAEEDGDKLTLDELYSTSVLLLVAGHETTTRLIGSAVWLLLNHPDQLEAALADDALMASAIEETLRLEPPVQIAPRLVKEDFEYQGHAFKQSQLVLLSIASANRDARVYENPDAFDIHRPAQGHMSFGHGIHLCLGIHLARLEAGIAIKKLFEAFPDLSLAEEPLDWQDSAMFRGLLELNLEA